MSNFGHAKDHVRFFTKGLAYGGATVVCGIGTAVGDISATFLLRTLPLIGRGGTLLALVTSISRSLNETTANSADTMIENFSDAFRHH